MATISAQRLYDERDEYGAISGNDLHAIFEAVCGDPTPRGSTRITVAKLIEYGYAQRIRYVAHKASGGIGGQYLLDIADFCQDMVGLVSRQRIPYPKELALQQ